jgi:hypothetical protein
LRGPSCERTRPRSAGCGLCCPGSKQQRDELPRTREGTLYRAGYGGRVHGRGNANAADRKQAEATNVRPA